MKEAQQHKACIASFLCTLQTTTVPFRRSNTCADESKESPSTPLFRWLLRAALARQAWVWGVVSPLQKPVGGRLPRQSLTTSRNEQVVLARESVRMVQAGAKCKV